MNNINNVTTDMIYHNVVSYVRGDVNGDRIPDINYLFVGVYYFIGVLMSIITRQILIE